MQICDFNRIGYSVLYHVFLWLYCDDFLEDIDKPLWVQDHCVFEVGFVLTEMSKIDDPTQVMVEHEHRPEIFTDIKRSSHVPDLEYELASIEHGVLLCAWIYMSMSWLLKW